MTDRVRATRPPRLAVTGSAGVGKTTLARRLAGELDVPFLDEGMRRRLESGLDPHAMSREAFRDLVLELFDEMLAAVDAALREPGGFVADRAALDGAAFWLYYGFGADAEATESVFERARAALAAYDLIVVLPWGVLPLAADGVRSPSPWVQLHYQTLIEGLLDRYARPDQVARLPTEVRDLDARVTWVRDRLPPR